MERHPAASSANETADLESFCEMQQRRWTKNKKKETSSQGKVEFGGQLFEFGKFLRAQTKILPNLMFYFWGVGSLLKYYQCMDFFCILAHSAPYVES